MIELVKDLLTAREPGAGYFGGAEGALRFLLFALILSMLVGIIWIAA